MLVLYLFYVTSGRYEEIYYQKQAEKNCILWRQLYGQLDAQKQAYHLESTNEGKIAIRDKYWVVEGLFEMAGARTNCLEESDR